MAFLAGTYLYSRFFIFSPERVLAPSVRALGLWGMIPGGEGNSFFETLPSRALTLMGRLSYGIYLFHFPVIFALWAFLAPFPPPVSFAAVAVITALIAWISSRFFEVPAQKKIIRTFAPA